MMKSRPSKFHARLSIGKRGVSLLTVLALAGGAQAQAPAIDDDVEIEIEASPGPTTPATPGAADPAAPPSAVSAPASQADVAALRTELTTLKRELEATRSAAEARAKAEAEAETAAQAKAEADEQRKKETEKEAALLSRIAKLGVWISGYIQVQYSRNELSQDQLLQGGSPLNQNRFAVRRGRLRVNGRWKYVRSDFELDGSNTRGPSMSVRRASLSGVLPSGDENAPPLLLLTAGLTEIPLGLELQQGQDEILFLERTTGSLAFFAGPVDTGGKLEGAYGPLRLQLAVMNGVPLDDRAGGPSAIDPTNAPDYLGRVGLDSKPIDALRIAGGVSFLSGKGFHPGADSSKPVLQWDDANADGKFQTVEVKQVAGQGLTPSTTFDRWAVAADLEIDFRTWLGWSKLYGEVALASNLDRALYVADPTFTRVDVRELSWYVAGIQDVTEWGFLGVRYDVYDPNSDAFDSRRGTSVPLDASIETLSPVAGVRWPGVGRLTFQYDFVKDHLARDRRGVPTDVKNNQWTLRAQGEF